MPMFDVEGKSTISAKDSTTTDSTFVRSSGKSSTLNVEIDNCHAGPAENACGKPEQRTLQEKAVDWFIEHSIAVALGLVSLILAGFFHISK